MSNDRSWNLNKLAMLVLGLPLPPGGIQGDASHQVEWLGDAWEQVQGADGSVEYCKLGGDKLAGKLTIPLMQTNPFNALMGAAFNLDQEAGAGGGIMVISDLNGGSTLFAGFSRIVTPAKPAWGSKTNPREWVVGFSSAVSVEVGIP